MCVAVKIRPLIPMEVDQGCRLSLSVTPGQPQVRRIVRVSVKDVFDREPCAGLHWAP